MLRRATDNRYEDQAPETQYDLGHASEREVSPPMNHEWKNEMKGDKD
jgi:hypothetical protein